MIDKQPGATLFVIDDTPDNLLMLRAMLEERRYRVCAFPRGGMALEAAKVDPPDLVLLDIDMPEMDGYEVCRRLKEDSRLQEIPVLFVSALTQTLDKVTALSMGGVDYITKPFHFAEVEARVNTHLALYRYQHHLQDLVEAQVRETAESQMSTIFALAKLVESRDTDTSQHLERVQMFCRLLAQRLREWVPSGLGIDVAFIENLYHASPLHDIGKVGIPDAVLLKPGRYTDEEIRIMREHTVIGSRTLEAARARYPRNAFINMGVVIARSHHERWDGTGYPDGLGGEDIPLAARILAVADVYDALRSRRCYKRAYTHEESRAIIATESGRQFDPVVVEAFLSLEQELNRIRREEREKELQSFLEDQSRHWCPRR